MSEVQEQTSRNLPSNYGEDRISLLARDPNWLYVYWEITKEKIDAFIMEFGSEVWDKSIPVLKVTNITKGESSYIRINDFSDSWYINVQEPNSLYMVEIGRRVSDSFFISIAQSNQVSTPCNNMSSNTDIRFVNITDMTQELQLPESSMLKTAQRLKLRSVWNIDEIGLSSESFLKG